MEHLADAVRWFRSEGGHERRGDQQQADLPEWLGESDVEWTADGGEILFHRFEHAKGRWGIFAVHLDGTGLREVTHGAPGDSEFPSVR